MSALYTFVEKCRNIKKKIIQTVWIGIIRGKRVKIVSDGLQIYHKFWDKKVHKNLSRASLRRNITGF